MLATRDLAVYAALVASADALWTIYRGVVLDRARIVVRPARYGAHGGPGPPQELFGITVSNRGRRAVTVESIAQMTSSVNGVSIVTYDLMQQTAQKPRLEESQSKTFQHGLQGGYSHGDISTTRWYVVDGAGRIHPLRERYRQRIERLTFWPVRRVTRWRKRRRVQPDVSD